MASALALLWSSALSAQAPQPPEVAARHYILLDLTTGQTLAERDADTPADPASLTKLMTAYLVFGALRDKKLTLEQPVAISQRAWDERKGEPSLMFIDTTMTPEGRRTAARHDRAVGQRRLGGAGRGASAARVENFVAMMNRQAQAWGLKNTQLQERRPA